MTPEERGFAPDMQRHPDQKYSRKFEVFWTVTCSACNAPSIAVLSIHGNDITAHGHITGPRTAFAKHDVVRWEPRWVEGASPVGAPQHIENAAGEAYRCHSIGAHMAAILMARTTIEAAAKERGITKGSLKEKIQKLADGGHIRAALADVAHAVRDFGNDMAHGDIQDPVTSQDAQQVLALLRFVLVDLYEVAATMNAVGLSLNARKGTAASPSTVAP